ncbi:hypothetical protein VSH64_41710 [Amycolatopsis rhabdoformis]|uniref:Uncharacterized protein n=1 Tax=Amycolatopsis rhabdoformis TaxID=1448059 RepID=A0ABZ1I4Y4_9PSEU|nr:hypothetical protein [Amycolatopsis rhabdoformis]WSE29259.1 hypothetical protein VSH64_41710 [Amycolatopsis rhabdoformis]
MSYSDPYTTYQPPVYEAPPPSRALARVFSGLLGLVLTPVAFGLLAAGGYRQQVIVMEALTARRDGLGIALTVAGAILLLGVAALGAWSSTGPLLGGVVWGVLPGVVALAMPEWGFDLLNALPHGGLSYGLSSWLFSGALLASGFLLVGTGLAATVARRRIGR